MYNKKCKSTFLFILALLCLITLIVPFMNVNTLVNATVMLKIVHYFTIVIFSICLVLIILIGIFNLFKNNFTLLPVQEVSAYIALIMLLINILVFSPVSYSYLSVGYSILILEAFVMATLSDLIKLFRKMPRAIKNIVLEFKAKRQEKLANMQEENETLIVNNEIPENEETIINQTVLEDEEVKIIPPDDEMV